MKKILLIILICLIPLNSYALDKINGNQIVLLTAKERQDFELYEELTHQRAVNLCKLLGKNLITYSYEEIYCDYCKDEYKKLVVPTETGLRTPSYDDVDAHYHDGGIAVAVMSLGFVPIIIQYRTRIITDIKCGEQPDYVLE